MWFKLLNAVFFYGVWFSVVIHGNEAVPLALLLIFLNLLLDRRRDVTVVSGIIITALGTTVDSLLSYAGVFDLGIEGSIIPIWLVLLWFAYSTTLNAGLSLFKSYPLISMIVGGISGAGSYIAGSKLGAVFFPFGDQITFYILAGVWAFIFPLSLGIDSAIEGRGKYQHIGDL